jgi:hypothetical protein
MPVIAKETALPFHVGLGVDPVVAPVGKLTSVQLRIADDEQVLGVG